MTYVLIVQVLQTILGFLKSGFVFSVVVFVIFFYITIFIQCFYYCMGLNMRNKIIVIAYYLNMYHNIIFFCRAFPCIARVSNQCATIAHKLFDRIPKLILFWHESFTCLSCMVVVVRSWFHAFESLNHLYMWGLHIAPKKQNNSKDKHNFFFFFFLTIRCKQFVVETHKFRPLMCRGTL